MVKKTSPEAEAPNTTEAAKQTRAVFIAGGKQYTVSVGDRVRIEKLDVDAGENFIFDQVLLIEGSDVATKIGQPLIAGASVQAKILSQGKAKKVIVFKHKRRKGYRRKIGHRQPFTEVQIQSING